MSERRRTEKGTVRMTHEHRERERERGPGDIEMDIDRQTDRRKLIRGNHETLTGTQSRTHRAGH